MSRSKVIGIGFCFVMSVAGAKAQQENAGGGAAASAEPLSRAELFEKVKEASLVEEMKNPPVIVPQTFNLPPDFFFPTDARIDKSVGKPREKVIFGIDVSHHEGTNLKLDVLRLQKMDFVYVKATQGVTYQDKTFNYYWNALAAVPKEQRPLRGAYHFMSALEDPLKQADYFVDYVMNNGKFDKGKDLPPCLDLEWDVLKADAPDKWKGQSPDKILEKVQIWLKRVKERTQITPMIYTARSWWLDRGIPEAKFALFNENPIWLADYSKSHKAIEKPGIINSRPQTLWQFADDAKMTTGFHGGLDASIFYGTQDEFNKAFGISP